MKTYMKEKKIHYIVVGIIFIIAACCFTAGTINHIINTGEGVISSILLALGCVCGAFVFLRKK